MCSLRAALPLIYIYLAYACLPVTCPNLTGNERLFPPSRTSHNSLYCPDPSILPRTVLIQIDWVSMTRKWGFDILDGMHHGQPPTRMLAYLLMHHVCHATESER